MRHTCFWLARRVFLPPALVFSSSCCVSSLLVALACTCLAPFLSRACLYHAIFSRCRVFFPRGFCDPPRFRSVRGFWSVFLSPGDFWPPAVQLPVICLSCVPAVSMVPPWVLDPLVSLACWRFLFCAPSFGRVACREWCLVGCTALFVCFVPCGPRGFSDGLHLWPGVSSSWSARVVSCLCVTASRPSPVAGSVTLGWALLGGDEDAHSPFCRLPALSMAGW